MNFKTKMAKKTKINKNMNKTTGILSLIEGVAEGYKEETINTNFKFLLKRK